MRLQATHFVEVWKGTSGVVYSGQVSDVYWIKISLQATSELGFETIAIFKIKMK